jgi:ABC-type multidrug transport system fused ATPase/permease subunit
MCTDEAARGRTTVAVAHRLSSLRRADAICVVVNGRIVEVGSHDELILRKGVYYEVRSGVLVSMRQLTPAKLVVQQTLDR